MRVKREENCVDGSEDTEHNGLRNRTSKAQQGIQRLHAFRSIFIYRQRSLISRYHVVASNSMLRTTVGTFLSERV